MGIKVNELENITFEKGLERLEKIVNELSQNNTTLENALTLFEEGIYLVRHCNNLLDLAEAKVKVLLEVVPGRYVQLNTVGISK